MSQPPRRSLTKTDLAFAEVRALIESGTVRPGDALKPQQLAERLGMSPTPVREALRLLQAEGLVVSEPHHGMSVRRYSPQTVDEVYQLRIVLEPLATRWAIERATDADTKAVQRAHRAMERDLEKGATRGGTLNGEWHHSVYRPCGSTFLLDFIDRLWSALPVTGLWTTAAAARSVAEHAEITAAFSRRDADTAADLMCRHLGHGRERDLGRMSDERTDSAAPLP